MPTTTEFDTFHHDKWSGEMTITVLDNDDTQNRVLDITQPWKIKVRWSLYSEDPTDAPVDLINNGHWRIDAYVESIGTAAVGTEGPALPFANVPFFPPLAGGSASEYRWEHTLTVPTTTINEPGIYKVTVMIQYHKQDNTFTQMVGFAEHPMICFSRLP